MSDDTKTDAAAEAKTAAEAAAKEAQEAADKAAADAAAKAEAEEKARAEGFADAQAKADAIAAAEAKPKTPRKSKQKPQPAAGIKPLGIEAAMELVKSGDHGSFAVRFGNEHGPHRDIPPAAAPGCSISRGRIVTGDELVMRTRDLSKRTVISHAWLFDGDKPLVPQELGAPVNIAPGEQFVIQAGRFAFF